MDSEQGKRRGEEGEPTRTAQAQEKTISVASDDLGGQTEAHTPNERGRNIIP